MLGKTHFRREIRALRVDGRYKLELKNRWKFGTKAPMNGMGQHWQLLVSIPREALSVSGGK